MWDPPWKKGRKTLGPEHGTCLITVWILDVLAPSSFWPRFLCLSDPSTLSVPAVCLPPELWLITHLITPVGLWDTIPETEPDACITWVPLEPREITAWGSLWPRLPTGPPNLAIKSAIRQKWSPGAVNSRGLYLKIKPWEAWQVEKRFPRELLNSLFPSFDHYKSNKAKIARALKLPLGISPLRKWIRGREFNR